MSGSDKLRLLCFLGTRPEAIKLAPIILAARERDDVECRVVSSGQHPRRMLEVFDYFSINTELDLGLFQEGLSIAGIHSRAVAGFASDIALFGPDVVLVQGDTTSALAGALAAFYARVPIAHVEAGLRTRNLGDPFPEEMNRRLIDTFADYLFPPTAAAERNLLVEGIRGAEVFVTGNTVVDALHRVAADDRPMRTKCPIVDAFNEPNGFKHRVLVTVHRRESWGRGIDAVADAIRKAADRRPDVLFLVPLNPNPTVRRSFVGDLAHNIVIGDPLPYSAFTKVLAESDLVVTDSGGVFEEATSLGKRVVVVRRCTERPEALGPDAALVASAAPIDVERAVWAGLESLRVPKREISRGTFGDGRAGERTIDWLRWRHGFAAEPPGRFVSFARLSTGPPPDEFRSNGAAAAS